MLTLDLFNTRHERELQEGAVDNTIARLIEPLHRRAADIRTELRGGNLTSMRRAHLEREYQDLVDKRLEIINGPKPVHSEPQTDECMGYGTLVGETGLPDVADKKAKMARLNQPGKVGTDVVKPQQRVNPTPNKGVVGHAADWLRGKGGPGKEGPTYESELDEEGTYDIPPQYMFVLDQIKAGFDEGKPYVEITLPNRETVPMTRPQMFNVLATFGNMNRKQLKKTMVRFFDTKRDMLMMLGSPVIKRYQTPAVPKPQQDPQQPGLGLDDPNKIAEAQKKNSPEADLSGNTARDPVVARELRKMRGRQPSASSDIEALVRDEMDQAERTEQTIAQQQTEIDRQQQQLTQLIQANQTQSSDITAQGREIDNLSRDLQRAVADLQATKVAPTPVAQPAQPKAEPTAAEPAYMPPPVPQATAVDADVQKQIQDLSKDLTMATLKMKEPGVSQAEHDKLQQAVTTLRSEIEKLKQSKPAKAPGKLNYKKVQPKSAKPKRAGDDAKFMGNVDQGAAQLAHDPYDFSQYSTMAKPVRPARKVAQQVELGLDEGAMSELDIERQDLERMTDQQFLKNYGISKEFWKYKNQAVLKKPARRPMSAQLARSPVGKKMNAMYGSTCPGCGRSTNPDRCVCEGLTESDNPKMDQLIKMIQAGKITAAGLKDPAVRPRIMQLVQQAGPEANIEQLIATYAPAAQVKATNVNDLKSAARRGVVNAPYPRTSAGTPGYSQQHSTFEGFQDFNKVEPYAVCLAGKPVKKFDYYEQARQFHDNWKKKLYREGNKEKADKITLMPIMKEATNRHFGPKGAGTELARQIKSNGDLDRTKQPEPTGVYKKNEFDITRPKTKIQVKKNKDVTEAGSPAQQAAIAIAMKKAHKKPKQVDEDTGSWIVYDPETKQIKKRFKTHTAGKSYAQTHGLGFASSEYYFDNIKQGVAENDDWDDGEWSDMPDAHVAVKAKQPTRYPEQVLRAIERNPAMRADIIADYKRKQQGVAEAETDYSKRRQRERDVDAGKPVSRQPKNPQTDYARKRAKQREQDRIEGLREDQDSGVEQAILRRIMVAHTDLLRQFGPEKVMQAAEEVAYNVGDVDEIGSSDVSAYVNQVRQILGAV